MAVIHSTGQHRPPLEIIRTALRDAATAPTVYDALDVTGDALRHLAELAPACVAWLVIDGLEQIGLFVEHEEASRFADKLEHEGVRIVRVLVNVAEVCHA